VTDQIERIEVLRGPQTAFTGPDMGGVVNIITRQASEVRVAASPGGGWHVGRGAVRQHARRQQSASRGLAFHTGGFSRVGDCDHDDRTA
jgi:outer membrane receptor for ferrienterochelin and colicin